jgi:hypothetical protein
MFLKGLHEAVEQFSSEGMGALLRCLNRLRLFLAGNQQGTGVPKCAVSRSQEGGGENGRATLLLHNLCGHLYRQGGIDLGHDPSLTNGHEQDIDRAHG